MSEKNDAFEAAEFALRQSWEVHRQAFGPILPGRSNPVGPCDPI